MESAMKTRYRVESTGLAAKAKRASTGKAMPLALIGLAGYVLWNQRDRLNQLVQSLTAGTNGGAAETSPPAEQVPDDYDWNRPSVANSTAMAGPMNGAGDPRGLDGGSMGTDLGTQGEGAQ
jgi:hypothetical protein